MIRSSADNLKPPTVIRKRNRNGTYTWIGVVHPRSRIAGADHDLPYISQKRDL